MSTAVIDAPPSTQQVEKELIEYGRLTAELADAEQKHQERTAPIAARMLELKAKFLEQVMQFGSAHAEKSKILHGITWELVASFGTSTTIDAAAVERFRLALVKGSQTRLIGKIFEKTERWTLRDCAGDLIRANKLSDKLLALYSQCSVTRPKTPTLTVRTKAKG